MERNSKKSVLLVLLVLFVLFLFRLWSVVFSPNTPNTPKIPNIPKTPNSLNPFTPLQKKLEANLLSFLPNKEAGLLSGIVLGSKKSLSSSLYWQLQQTGTIHIVVASGMNITLLAGFIFPILTLFLKRKIALLPLSFLIWFYALLTGFQPPIIRASIMASLTYLGQEFGRPADSKRILWLTGYVMVLFDPALIGNLAFQLSFMSMLGLIYLGPIFSKAKNRVLKLFASTLACQIATIPLIMSSFGEYNLLSPLINLLVLWTTPYILGMGLLSAFFSLFIRPIAQLLAYLTYPFLAYFMTIIAFFAGLNVFQIWTPKWGIGLATIYYSVLGLWIYHINNTNRC